MSDIHTKLASIAGEIGAINKTERNKEQGFNFRSIEAITGAVRPLLAKEGVSIAPKMLSLESSEVTAKSGARGFRSVVEMQYTFTAGSDDSSVTVSMPGEAVDYGDKSTSKAVQMAYKYALTQVLQVGSGDDPDAHSVEIGHSDSPPRRQNRTRATETAPESTESERVVDYAREAVKGFISWSADEKAEAYKRHSQNVLGGKPKSVEEAQQVIGAMRHEYDLIFPAELPL